MFSNALKDVDGCKKNV